MSESAPAGWYGQPDGTERYWDGGAWTAHHRPAPLAAVAPPRVTHTAPSPRVPLISVLASVFLPGLGTMVNGDIGKGILILVLYCVAVVFSFALIGIPFAIGIWVWGLVDAYAGAVNWNIAHGFGGSG